MPKENHPLRINIGFVIHEDVGYSRTFDFSFPRLYLDEDLVLSDADGSASFSRIQEGVLAKVEFSGTTMGECGRCLDDAEILLHTEFTELYSFHRHRTSDSDLVLPEHGQIDLAPILREYLLLEMPINPLCKAECLGLCPRCGKNLNNTPHTHKEDALDPRLAVLQELLKKPAPAKKKTTSKKKASQAAEKKKTATAGKKKTTTTTKKKTAVKKKQD